MWGGGLLGRFNVEVDGLFVVAYGMVVCGVDLMWR